jgi:hypothetical protein
LTMTSPVWSMLTMAPTDWSMLILPSLLTTKVTTSPVWSMLTMTSPVWSMLTMTSPVWSMLTMAPTDWSMLILPSLLTTKVTTSKISRAQVSAQFALETLARLQPGMALSLGHLSHPTTTPFQQAHRRDAKTEEVTLVPLLWPWELEPLLWPWELEPLLWPWEPLQG